MGMFDYIKFNIPCPVCKNMIDEFQSKDGDCEMETLEFWEVDRFYISCKHCGTWIEYNRIKERQPSSIEEYELTIKKKEEK